jgi:preprotein translocase subunit SecA
MINAILTKIMGSKNERAMKKMGPTVDRINALEPEYEKHTDAQLKAQKSEFKARLEAGETLEDLLPEAFAVVREASKRVLGMRHFDVQLIGGIILHEGKIAEMKTGEGKTLVSTLPAYLNALEGQGVHIITVNDYLARRDSEWMGSVHQFLGMSVGVIQHDMDDRERQENYGRDITYGTNNEFGFDYLRDNMKFSIEAMVQPVRHFAIVDEVDSILIDEARTPLIISGPAEESTDMYNRVNAIIPKLTKGAVIREGKLYEVEESGDYDYVVDEKAKTVTLTEAGEDRCQQILGIQDIGEWEWVRQRYVDKSLRAHLIFQKDVDYMVKDGQVVIVDEFTGRLMPGRRWSDGLHQAVEAKEGLKIERENQTLATITFQNYFRMYDKLSGMTGTADTEAVEFDRIYKLEVLSVPTHKDMIRDDQNDVILRTEAEKWRAVVEDLAECQKLGQPVLVGTISIERSEKLSGMLKKRAVKHVVLNAKQHENEAEIVAQAGRVGAVTIATNMAGRGTDILLGGNPEFLARRALAERGIRPGDTPAAEYEPAFAQALDQAKAECEAEHEKVIELGGLHIAGTERHESRRIDNQLRGRAGRQGDPGSSRFYLSLDDDLMRIFAGEKLKTAMKRLGMEEDMPIESPMVSRSIERAQKQVEMRNFDIRNHLLEYDDVNNKQRNEIYSLRRGLLEGREQKEYVVEKARDILEMLIEEHMGMFKDPGDWQIEPLAQQLRHFFGFDVDAAGVNIAEVGLEQIGDVLWERLLERYDAKEAKVGPEIMRQFERQILLQIIDTAWKDHLLAMDHLKEGIGLRAYGQKDPLVEYKRESFEMFGQMKERIENESIRFLFLVEPMTSEEREREAERRRAEQEQIFASASRSAAGVTARGGVQQIQRKQAKVGRNDPCPCGSGKKYKKCHGAAGAA